ncbi:MAG TPA: hypothetical protein VFL59_07965 [Candidatus Nanopelagicales bacterium]|nr:hypothetical protein [Candidatus Nanopelagicales bacterium]
MTEISNLRDVLSRVAAGDLDPVEAARLLDEDPAAPTLDRTSDVPASPSGSVAAILIRAGGVKLTVVADPTVDTLVADGAHSLRHDGSTLVLESPREEGYQTEPPPRFLGWVPGVVWTAGRGEKVHVRVNPDLPLTVDTTACGVEIIGTRSSLTLAGSASSVKVRDHVGTLHGTLSMGSLAVVGVVTGPSDLSCELGSLDLRLDRGSDATVSAVVEMGSLKVAGGDAAGKSSSDGSTSRTVVAGNGTHPFGVTVRMGSATIGVAS